MGKLICMLLSITLIHGCATSTSQQEGGDKAEGEKNIAVVDERPNIVVILADDLGFSDLQCYGGEINTPNLDQLASNGMRFTQFYNTSRCCPTRASLLTGIYPHQAGIGRMTFDTGKPGYRGFLTENTVTVAEVLKDAGYNTGMTGKWHVSETERLETKEQLMWLAHQENYGPFSDTSQYPVARGFDKFYGNIWGVVDYFDPFSLVNGMEQVMDVPEDFYYTDAISDSSVAYVEQFSSEDKPFFLYVAHTAPHWPLQALEEDIAKYENTYDEGWQALRERRYNKMIEMSLFNKETAPLPPWMFPEQDWENNPDKEWDARAMAVHAAMVDRMDQGIGRLIDKLQETGELDNTLILFLSDNGASSERPSKYGPGFDRAGSTREGEEVHFPVNKEHLPGPQTVHAGLGPQWAHAINVPFRFWKSKVYDGGIATPLIAHWPKGITQRNTINEEQGHVIDLMATAVELAQTRYPDTYKGRQITPMQGTSLVPIFTSGEREDPEYLFWEHFGSKGLRQGEWKIVQLEKNSEWQLYNLEQNRTETNNVASQYPERVKEMVKKWDELSNVLMVYPAPN